MYTIKDHRPSRAQESFLGYFQIALHNTGRLRFDTPLTTSTAIYDVTFPYECF